MKAFAILSVVATAVLSMNISAASSQGACQQEYTACMDSCATRSSKSMQDTCFNSCEGRNNMCAERIYGKRPLNNAPTTAAAPQSTAKDALAKEPAAAPQAAEPAPQAAEPAPQPEPAAPAARPRR